MRLPRWLLGLVWTWGAACTVWGACAPADPGSPRTLIISLDGVSYRILEQAREQGAFEGWPETKPLVSTFPSMTNIAFTAILKPMGVQPISGYELRHYDYETNKLTGGGPMGYKAFGWRYHYQVMDLKKRQKAKGHLYPRKRALKNLKDIETLIFTEPRELMLGHLESTDFLAHFKGDAPVVQLMIKLSDDIERWQARHQEMFGRPLRVVLLSDHGNTLGKVNAERGIRKRLKREGFRIRKRLEKENDVVTPTYGVVGYGILFVDPKLAPRAARAVLDHPAVELASWISREGEIVVESADARAGIFWSGEPDSRRIRYRPIEGDPLHLSDALDRLAASGQLDADGYASEHDWFEASALDDYPDAPRRLIDSLMGAYVDNPATVIFSLAPGRALGLRTAQFGAFLLGGKLEGTHGGLDRASSLAFFLRSDVVPDDSPAVRADHALREWSHLSGCLDPNQVLDHELTHTAE